MTGHQRPPTRIGFVSGLCERCESSLALDLIVALGEDLDPMAEAVNAEVRQRAIQDPEGRIVRLRELIRGARIRCELHREIENDEDELGYGLRDDEEET